MRSTPPWRIASVIDTAREESRLLTSLPSASATSSAPASLSGEFGMRLASRSNSLRTNSAVVAIPFPTEAAIQEPPSTGDAGRLESPSLMVMLSRGSPSMSAATCAMIVCVPVPISEHPQAISAWPLAESTMRTVIAICIASHTALAMPHPISSLPSRIERGSALRRSQPKASAPAR